MLNNDNLNDMNTTKQAHQHSTGFRLSPQQRLRWSVDLPTPSITLDIKGSLDQQQLRQTLQSLIEIHEPLRTQLQFTTGLKTPLQSPIINNATEQLCTLEGLTQNGGFSNLTEKNSAQIQRGVNARLEQLNKNNFQLHLSLPALSADRGTLLRLAQALTVPSTYTYDQDNMTYIQYSTWLYDLQDDDDAKIGYQFWSEQFNSNVTSDNIVYKEQITEDTPTNITTKTVNTDPKLTAALNTFCKINNYTPHEVFLTAWAILLKRLSSDIDNSTSPLRLNWVNDCRNDYEELETCWGLFARALPLQWLYIAEEGFINAIERILQCQDDAREWQEYFAVNSDIDLRQSRYGFEWGGNTGAMTAIKDNDQSIEVIGIQAQTQMFELLLIPEKFNSTNELNQHYRINLNYDVHNYTEQTATTLLEQLQSLIFDAISNVSKTVGQLTLASPTTEKILQDLEGNTNISQTSVNEVFPAIFSHTAHKYGNFIALFENHRVIKDDIYNQTYKLSYNELEQRSNQLAHALLGLGIKPESRIALYFNRSVDMVLAMLAILKTGCAFLPLEPQQPEARIRAILNTAKPDLILRDKKLYPPNPINVPHWSVSDKQLAHYPSTLPNVKIHPDNAAYVLFTSGSTGTPKGVIIAHRQLQNYITSILSRIDLKPKEKSAIVTSLTADLSYTLLFSTLLSGGELHIIDSEVTLDPQAWADYQAQYAIDNLKVVPSLLDAWINHHKPQTLLPKKQLLLGGEPCKPPLLKKIQHYAPLMQIYNHYGPTETTVGVLLHKIQPTINYLQIPLDQRLDQTRIYLLDEHCALIAPGQQAELYIAGANIARGYLSARQTAERFIPNPFSNKGERLYKSGDIARYRPNGAINIVGRTDRQVKIRGFRIELDEVEVLISQLFAVQQCAAVCVQKENDEKHLCAFISLVPESQISVSHMQEQLHEQLPEHMRPTLRIVEHLPLLTNGKVDRKTLHEQAQHQLRHLCTVPPRTPIEQLLTNLWADVLGIEKTGIEDNFFDLGGHSLAAVKLASRLQKLLATQVTVNAIFTAPTVAQFVKLIDKDLKISTLVNLSSNLDITDKAPEKKPSLFCFHPSTGHVEDYREVSEQLSSWHVWGIQANYLTEHSDITNSIDSLVTSYVEQIRKQQSHGPYYLLGWSLGGLIAVKAAAQLEKIDEKIAFLGVVDSQTKTDSQLSDKERSEVIEDLLQMAIQELDTQSQSQLKCIEPEKRDALVKNLKAHDEHQWVPLLSEWAQRQGLQLRDDSWKNLHIRLHYHNHTQRLIESFELPRLNCSPNIWWARETLQQSKEHFPTDWQSLTDNSVCLDIIESDHLNILKKTDWQQQLHKYLNNALQIATKQIFKNQDISTGMNANIDSEVV